MLTIDTLAQEIRRVDGNHSLGAGALAEALMPFISAALSIEQTEPVAEPAWWLVATDMGKVIFNGHDKARAERVSEMQGRPITPLYAHPPVSALVNAQADADVVERWQPIETAPRDGKHCILAVQEGAFIYAVQGAFDGKQWNAVHREGVEPLCWMHNCRIPSEFLPAGFSSLRPAEVGSATTSTGIGGAE